MPQIPPHALVFLMKEQPAVRKSNDQISPPLSETNPVLFIALSFLRFPRLWFSLPAPAPTNRAAACCSASSLWSECVEA